MALETVDLNKDPYFMRNHLGTYECKLCLTLHTTEGSYLAHTQAKKHKMGLLRRAKEEELLRKQQMPVERTNVQTYQKKVKIGRPGYGVTKGLDTATGAKCLTFEISYPDISPGIVPRYRFMSAYEQRIESPNPAFQYLLFAAEPYETIAFKIPNETIDKREGRFVTNFRDGKFNLTLFFVVKEEETKEELLVETAGPME